MESFAYLAFHSGVVESNVAINTGSCPVFDPIHHFWTIPLASNSLGEYTLMGASVGVTVLIAFLGILGSNVYKTYVYFNVKMFIKQR